MCDAGAVVGQGVVVLAARQVEQVARPQPDLAPELALELLVPLPRPALERRMLDRVLGPALEDHPGLLAHDVRGEHVVKVEMRAKGLLALGRQIEVGLNLAAQRLLQLARERGQLRRELVDVVEHQGGAAGQECSWTRFGSGRSTGQPSLPTAGVA